MLPPSKALHRMGGLVMALLAWSGCSGGDAEAVSTAFVGATVIVGDGETVLENATLVERDGTIVALGPSGSTEVPAGAERVDLTGRTLMPHLINVHGHVGYMRGAETSSELYSRENVLDHLRRSMYYGVAAVQSLGTDRDDTEIRIRDEQRGGALGDRSLARLFTSGRGVVAPTPDAPNGGPFFATDVVFETSTPEAGRAAIASLAEVRPDAVKLWVDDRGGTKTKLAPEVYRAVIDAAHQVDLTAIAHVYYLDDAKDLVEAGVDGFAHMVRAEPGADAELVAAVRDAGLFQCTTLTIQKRLVDPPSWIDDPALAETVSAEVVREWRDGLVAATPEAVTRSREAYARLERTLLRMYEGGVDLVLCGDTGLLSQAPGFTEHRELEAIVQAGVPVLEAIRIATSAGARVLGLTELGTLEVGKSADFLVLQGDPRADIANSRRIADVYRAGRPLDRPAMAAGLATR